MSTSEGRPPAGDAASPSLPDGRASVLVAGASGFAGALAARLVDRHPRFELRAATSRSDAGRRLSELYPHHRVDRVLEPLDLDALDPDLDAAIVAYPHGASAPVVAALRDRGVRVVDLSADFRLKELETYERHYAQHPRPELLDHAVYGLPELRGAREQLRAADLVAAPGCFPTAALLALAPLAEAGLIDRPIVVDAKTGVSGAGRKATQTTHFVSVAEDVKPYNVARHRHTPEIEQGLAALGADIAVSFTAHLLPLDQGELVSCYVDLPDGFDADVAKLYADRYADEPFVEVLDRPPGVREVRDTNLCAIHAVHDERAGRALVFAAIDNLWKGTASQAVQCLNLMFDRPEDEGIAP